MADKISKERVDLLMRQANPQRGDAFDLLVVLQAQKELREMAKLSPDSFKPEELLISVRHAVSFFPT